MKNPLPVIRTRLMRGVWAKMPPKVLTRLVMQPSFQWGADDDYTWYEMAYQRHGHVFTCVKTLSDFTGQIPLRVQKKTVVNGKEVYKALSDHPLQKTLNRPNPYLSKFDLKKFTLAYLELTGNAYWYLVKGTSGVTSEIWVLRPDRVEVVPSTKGAGVQGYIYSVVGNRPIPFLPEEIIHFKYFNPYDDFYGMSTLRAAKNLLAQDVYAQKWNLNFFKNNATPGGGLKFEQTLTEEEFKRISERWQKYHGGVDKAHSIAVFEKGASWVNMGIPPKDMEFLESQKFNQRQIGSIFGLVPVLMNDYERANYNNARTQIQFFTNITMVPKVLNLEDSINRALPDLAGASFADDLSVSFAISEIWAMKQDEQTKSQIEQTQITTGRRTINEIRAENNEDPVPWGDTWFMPMGVSPYGEEPASEEPANEEPKPGESESRVRRQIVKRRTPDERRRELIRAEVKAFGITRTFFEAKMRKLVTAVFEDQKKEVKRNLLKWGGKRSLNSEQTKSEESIVESVLFDLDEAVDELEGIARPMYGNMVNEGGKRMFRLARVQGTFDITDPRARAVMKAASQRFARDINETTWNRLKASLVEGMREGETIIALADRVEGVMQTRIASDKWTIARTEVLGALNGGADVGLKEAEIETKEWASAGDAAVRESHVEVDGQEVPVDGVFSFEGMAGGTVEMEYPGDPSAPVEEVANCRCTIMPGRSSTTAPLEE